MTPDNFRTRALTPWMLSNAARALIRSGESVWDISVFDGAVRLASGCILGYFRPSGPAKRGATLYSFPGLRLPKLSTSRGEGFYTFNSAAMLARHRGAAFRLWGLRAQRGGWRRALEERLGQEADTAVGYLLPVPSGDPSAEVTTIRWPR